MGTPRKNPPRKVNRDSEGYNIRTSSSCKEESIQLSPKMSSLESSVAVASADKESPEGIEGLGLSVRVKLPEGDGELAFQFVPLEDLEVALRQMLSEHPQTCAYTNYRIIIESADDSAHPRFLTEAFDAVEYVNGLPADTPPVLRLTMTFEPYCIRTLRQHVRRFLDVLQRHPPVALPQAQESQAAEETEAGAQSAQKKKEKMEAEGERREVYRIT